MIFIYKLYNNEIYHYPVMNAKLFSFCGESVIGLRTSRHKNRMRRNYFHVFLVFIKLTANKAQDHR